MLELRDNLVALAQAFAVSKNSHLIQTFENNFFDLFCKTQYTYNN
jgi:hypothetical protein